ncbi:hypothetical protein [Pseudomonas savastanoi]|uniref:hypothetical protein n=1 Tax=Pseudomonas savastanoi TaxID=29438 RepID=UPI001F3F8417
MTGTPGTGKTHLAAAIAGHIIAHHNATAVYRTVGGLLQYIKGSYGDRAEYTETGRITRRTHTRSHSPARRRGS